MISDDKGDFSTSCDNSGNFLEKPAAAFLCRRQACQNSYLTWRHIATDSGEAQACLKIARLRAADCLPGRGRSSLGPEPVSWHCLRRDRRLWTKRLSRVAHSWSASGVSALPQLVSTVHANTPSSETTYRPRASAHRAATVPTGPSCWTRGHQARARNRHYVDFERVVKAGVVVV